MPALAAAHQSGETMASTRTRLDATALNLGADLVAHRQLGRHDQGRRHRAPEHHRALHRQRQPGRRPRDRGADQRHHQLPDHIAPLWTRSRGTNGANTCTNCHSDTGKLDLRATIAGTGRLVSYEELLVGDPVIDPATGQPSRASRTACP